MWRSKEKVTKSQIHTNETEYKSLYFIPRNQKYLSLYKNACGGMDQGQT